MSNFYTDNPDLMFTLENLEMEELVALREDNYKQAEKFDYAPENFEDAKDNYKRILSVIGEELGFVAMVGVIIAYLLFFYFALKISCNARSRQGLYTGFGIAVTIVFQALINIGVVSGALPTKGIPAPLLSYGGSSLLMFGIALGILLNIAADTVSPDFNQQMWSRFSSHFRKKK